MPSKPWYNVVTPREDLREGKPLDAAEFAVHLDRVRTGDAPTVYQNPEQFFQRTYLTRNLTSMAAEVMRRLSGETTQTSAVFNLATQFGGGKTHALTLLYHLARHGPKSHGWMGVQKLLDESGLDSVPSANAAVFVGMGFDSIKGRGGDDGTPRRYTPWGEIAYQLGGAEAFEIVRQHDEARQTPAGDVLHELFSVCGPSLILMDEVMNYVNVNRRSGMGAQFYSFVQNLSEAARSEHGVVLVVSMPASNMEMSVEDAEDYDRFDKLLDRLGKAVLVSAESETSEIVRRRLFEWDETARSRDGRVLLSKDAIQTCNEYARWVQDNRSQLPQWFPIDNAQEAFQDSYPFHPALLSVFERKWQALPRFQRTRGVLRLLALWVSRAYEQGYRRTHRDPLIGLGTAPLEDSMFRSAMFEQLGENRLEVSVVTDITGRKDSHSLRLDNEAVDTIRKSRLHQKAATAIFFESNGGQYRAEATVPEIRLAVAEPGVDIGNVETVLESLTSTCYYLTVDRNTYRFGIKVNANKLLADKVASIRDSAVSERVQEEVEKVFSTSRPGGDLVLFPDSSNQIPNRPALTFVALAPSSNMQDREHTMSLLETMTTNHSSGRRRYANALVWCVADSDRALNDDARRLLAWSEIMDEQARLGLDEEQVKLVDESQKRAARDLKENVWRAYNHILLLGKDGKLREVDFGLVHSSSATSILTLVTDRLKSDGDIVDSLSPNFLVRNWPGRAEWSTRDVLHDCFASPRFPRVTSQDVIRDTVAIGVSSGIIAYCGKTGDGRYEPMHFETPLGPADVEISDDTFILTAEEARKHIEPPRLEKLTISPERITLGPGQRQVFTVKGHDQHGGDYPLDAVTWDAQGGTMDPFGGYTPGDGAGTFVVAASTGGITVAAEVTILAEQKDGPIDGPPLPPRESRLRWTGEITPLKWTTFYTRVLSRYANQQGLKLTVSFEVTDPDGVPDQRVQETKVALRELGMSDDVRVE